MGHVRRFYESIEYAGRKSRVLVVKGNHDECFAGDYVLKLIDSTPGCREISGRLCEVAGLRILGLGYRETHYLTLLRPLLAKFANKVDIVIAHCEQSRVPLLASIRPKLIIRGHFGAGKFLVGGIPIILTSSLKCAHIEFRNRILTRLNEVPQTSKSFLEFLKKHLSSRWAWLEPYRHQS